MERWWVKAEKPNLPLGGGEIFVEKGGWKGYEGRFVGGLWEIEEGGEG